MKKNLSIFLILTLLFSCMLVGTSSAYAATKKTESRAITIVFDNSGSMYDNNDLAWCRATYAMEVFASMLNDGDVLQIYPMNPITVEGKEYSMQNPLQITDASQSTTVRAIITERIVAGTPVESIDCAVKGLKELQADKKYMVVLTDGDVFSKGGVSLDKNTTIAELDKRIQEHAGNALKIMYLGIGEQASIPSIGETDHFVKKHAKNTADVLSMLTDMCNLIFGRDTLPKTRLSGNTMDFDISMKKLIVFVQGEDISDLKITSDQPDAVGKLVSSQKLKYSTKGVNDPTKLENDPETFKYNNAVDTSLQGMMVTYEGCASGKYNIEYSGTATSIEVYYEPDADLEFVFTDSEGNKVDLDKLYEGEYKVSYGMKDAKTGKLISSDLLGKPQYRGSYTKNGERTEISYDGYSGEETIVLKANDTFEAELTVTYLSGYTISKDSTDFGWPEGGVKVGAPPLGDFKATLSVPQTYIVIKEMAETQEMVVDLTLKGQKLTAEEFDSVTLDVDCGGIKYKVTPDKENSRYIIQLESTKDISEGKYPINIKAKYADHMERTASATDSAKVTLSTTPLWVKWVLSLLLLIILFIIIWTILHIKVLPKNVQISQKYMNYDGDDVTEHTSFSAEISRRSAKMETTFAGEDIGITMEVIPGKESFLYKAQKRRSAEVIVDSVQTIGLATIRDAWIANVKYVADTEEGTLVPAMPNQRAFNIKNGAIIKYSGTVQDAGIDKDFEVMMNINFKKK